MGYDISVLRAIVRLTRRRIPANHEALLVRVPGRSAHLRSSLRRLEQAGLVRIAPTLSLTLAGFAVAVASMPPKRAAVAIRAARAA